MILRNSLRTFLVEHHQRKKRCALLNIIYPLVITLQKLPVICLYNRDGMYLVSVDGACQVIVLTLDLKGRRHIITFGAFALESDNEVLG